MGECRECEAALLCRDFLRLGYSKFVVDPGVRLAYTADVARQRYTKKVPCCSQASRGRGQSCMACSQAVYVMLLILLLAFLRQQTWRKSCTSAVRHAAVK